MELWLMMYILKYLGERVLTSVSLKCFRFEDGLVDVQEMDKLKGM